MKDIDKSLQLNKVYSTMQEVNALRKKILLHLCADIGSDSRYYQLDDDYVVIMIGVDIGVENFYTDIKVHAIIGNPVCTKFSMAGGVSRTEEELNEGMFLVDHCLRVIKETSPEWWVIENPASGMLHKRLGKPQYKYQPWQYGSQYTKFTALWCSDTFVFLYMLGHLSLMGFVVMTASKLIAVLWVLAYTKDYK